MIERERTDGVGIARESDEPEPISTHPSHEIRDRSLRVLASRLGRMSSASMLFEASSATRTSMPRRFIMTISPPHCGRASASTMQTYPSR